MTHIDVDPALPARWRTGGEPNVLCLEVDDPAAAWSALSDVFDEVPTVPEPGGWSEAVVTPAGLLFRATTDAPAEALPALATRLEERGLAGRLAAASADGVDADALRGFATCASWVVAWLVPLRLAGLNFDYRGPREWRVRRFETAQVARIVSAVHQLGPLDDGDDASVCWSGGAFRVPVERLPFHVAQWLEHGSGTLSLLGRPNLAGVGATVVVTSVARGAELLGVGRVGPGLVDDTATATELLEQLTRLLVDQATGIAYGVVGVHETGTAAADGQPFREVAPATARAQDSSLSLRALDQWVLDAAPVQVLSRHHKISERDGLVEEPLAAGRRLLRIGRPADWFSGAARRSQVRNRGREAMAACLPPARTPLPAPLL